MRSFGKLIWVETKLFLREPFGFFFTLIFPVGMLFLFGSIYGNAPNALFDGRGTIDISVPGYTAMIIGVSGLMNVTMNLATYREHGILRRLRTTPVSPLLILGAQMVVVFVMTLVGMALLLSVAVLVYHVRIEGNAFSMLAGFALCCLSFFPIGLVLAAVSPTARTANIAGLILLYPMMFISGAGFPRELLPATIRRVGSFLPLTYVVNLLRGVWFAETWAAHTTDILILLGIMVAGVITAVLTFRWE